MIKSKLVWGGILLGIDFLIAPSFNILKVMLGVIALDFVTGIIKAKMKKVARTSEGFRRTMVKIGQYLVPVLLLWGASSVIPEHKEILTRASGYVMMFVIYIEVTSIFENLYEFDKNSVIAKFLYKPALVLLKLGIEKNPVNKAADKIKENEKQTDEKISQS